MIYSIGIEISGTHRFIRIYSQLNKPHYSTIGRKLGATSLWTSNCKILYSVGKMIEDSIDLSPDIEWMLQSNQVDSETIIEILVRDYYKPIFRLILSWLPYPEEAHRATQETLIIAASGDGKYTGERNVYDWLVGIAEEICQKCKTQIESHQILNPRLIQSINRRDSPEYLTERQLEKAKFEINEKIKSKSISIGNWARFQEIILLCFSLVIAFFLIRIIDSAVSSYDQSTESDQFTSANISTTYATENAVSARLPSIYSPPMSWTDTIPPQSPLTFHSTHDDIWKRIFMSRHLWTNLWADVLVILYSPTNDLGPPRVERHQIWFDQEIGGFYLSGTLDGKPEHFKRINATKLGSEQPFLIAGIEDNSRLSGEIPWFYLSSNILLSTPYISNFLFFIEDNDFLSQSVLFEVVDEFDWMDRQAVIVEMTDLSGNLLARYWLDSLTGLALKAQYPGILSQNNILLEVNVSKIEFNISFPLTIYRPIEIILLERGFPQDHTDELKHQLLEPKISPDQALSSKISPPLNPPPVNFDPSQSWLTFAIQGGSHQRQVERPVHIFGDSNYLGNIGISDPFRTICNRSKDGSKIVLAQWSDSPSKVSSKISEYDLLKLSQREYIIPEAYITFLAFSPYNRFIAVAGISPNKSRNELYIIDTLSGKTEILQVNEDIWSLAWSPDENQLAILSWPNSSKQVQSSGLVSLYNLKTGKATYYRKYVNLPWGKSNINVPIENWKANFQIAIGGLEPCAAPPNPSNQ